MHRVQFPVFLYSRAYLLIFLLFHLILHKQKIVFIADNPVLKEQDPPAAKRTADVTDLKDCSEGRPLLPGC